MHPVEVREFASELAGLEEIGVRGDVILREGAAGEDEEALGNFIGAQREADGDMGEGLEPGVRGEELPRVDEGGGAGGGVVGNVGDGGEFAAGDCGADERGAVVVPKGDVRHDGEDDDVTGGEETAPSDREA